MNQKRMTFADSDFRTATASTKNKKLKRCVAVAITPEGVGVRDSKDNSKKTLQFTPDEWIAFLDGVKKGEFDIV